MALHIALDERNRDTNGKDIIQSPKPNGYFRRWPGQGVPRKSGQSIEPASSPTRDLKQARSGVVGKSEAMERDVPVRLSDPLQALPMFRIGLQRVYTSAPANAISKEASVKTTMSACVHHDVARCNECSNDAKVGTPAQDTFAPPKEADVDPGIQSPGEVRHFPARPQGLHGWRS
jgi:hypothetical protein